MIDRRRWAAYGFFDCYFDPKAEKARVTQPLVPGSNGDPYEGIRPDPFTRGHHDANKPFLDPWVYFWVVLEDRMRQVRDDWSYLVDKLSSSITEYVRDSYS